MEIATRAAVGKRLRRFLRGARPPDGKVLCNMANSTQQLDRAGHAFKPVKEPEETTEMPEAAQDSTHYRTLFLAALVLFAMTFVVNTVAEAVRLRVRKRAYEL